ncbi:hypothetical protein [Lysobacter solisilvae (ex Woo and Kim 2020)]|uniref:Uncharacterized protein n=1 Tax=Agrilutibacter terrestris TaxID=2865112 RepID=A0A7H0FUW7_9GAMM|nr:hypothetical protein [Lysobacter terrestris]QNP39833.1 hypothetical protein H8B22_09970 [Lysobacter terrestris]
MPDFIPSPASDGAPCGWDEAFAALPQETPPGDGWSRIAAKLDAHASRRVAARRERRTNWLVGMASAAVLVLAAWSPLSRWLQNDGSAATATITATATPGSRGPAAPVQVDARTDTNARTERAAATRQTAPDAIAAVELVQPRNERSPHVAARRSQGARERAMPDAQATETRASPSPAQPDVAASIAAATTAATADPLPQLKTQSAQLEALVAMARDDRVGNASNQLLSSELDAGIAVVDAALSQADVTAPRQQELWQQRVDLLQQLAGVEATSRWLAAQGMSNETLLVSVD